VDRRAVSKVDGLDLVQVRQRQLAMPGDAIYSAFADVTGSGKIDGLDLVALRMRQMTMLPAGEPGTGQPAAAAGAAFAPVRVSSLFGRAPVREDDRAVWG